MTAIGEWIKVLRSGKYKQTYGKFTEIINGERYYCAIGIYIFDSQIIKKLMEHYDDTNWRVIIEDVIKMNDVDKLSFEEIADRLEAGVLTGAYKDIKYINYEKESNNVSTI